MGEKPQEEKTNMECRANEDSAKQVIEKFTEPEAQPKILTKEWQKATAEKSRQRGWIYVAELPFLLASDPIYDDLVPELWVRYQLDLRGPRMPAYETPGNRIEAWMKLIERWAFGRVGGVPRTDSEDHSKLKAIPYMRLSRYDAVNGRLIEIGDRTSASINYIVTLEELREYLTRHVSILLPKTLYPEKENQEEEGPDQVPQEILSPEFPPAPVLRAKTPMPFPCPEASWKDITITGHGDHSTIYIKNGLNGTSGVFSYRDLGMVDKKTKKHNSDWMLLYGIIANNGETPVGYRTDAINRNKASRLNKALQDAFGIHESVWVNKKDIRRDALRRSSYIAKFQTRKGSAFQPGSDTPNEYEEIFQDAQAASYKSLD